MGLEDRIAPGLALTTMTSLVDWVRQASPWMTAMGPGLLFAGDDELRFHPL
ncbi:hypothetical protein HJ590_15565 [Naumannella sp. ID2617S]|nr:hypothetical protein [Naumannella sp. ID2617S]